MGRTSKISVHPRNRAKRTHDGKMFIQGLPNDTKAAFKAACYRRDLTMRDVLIQFMRDFAERGYPGGIPGRPRHKRDYQRERLVKPDHQMPTQPLPPSDIDDD